jgi:hypothetical protein
VTLTCAQCNQPYEATASGRWTHRFIYSHAPSVGGKTERKG